MKEVFLFEFEDLKGIPDSLRVTFREALESCLTLPPRRYYKWVAAEILQLIRMEPVSTVAELGAGTAPITRELARILAGSKGISLVVSDLFPAVEIFKDLQRQYPDLVRADFRPVNFAQSLDFPAGSLLVLSATFHHIRPDVRLAVLKALAQYRVAIFEPLRRTIPFLFFAILGILPALATPIRLWNQERGKWRRIFWCWLIPVVPLIIVWDGWVSCLRCWTDQEWKKTLASVLPPGRILRVKSHYFCQMVSWWQSSVHYV